MLKKILKIFAICFGLFIILYICWSVYIKIQIDKGNLIKWDNKFYTKEELKQAFPPQEYDVPAKNTPEQVYAEFRQALLNNDIEGALAQIREKNREEYRQAFKDKEKFDKWVKSLPEKITEESELGNFSHYDIDYGTENKNTITFIKNSDGYWQVD
ncbi:MAG: hypothetical protein V1667_01715 [bacterium]